MPLRKLFASLHVGCDSDKERNDVPLEVRLPLLVPYKQGR